MNLLALVGRAGSGKDTVADILVRDHHWTKIALADPMKRAARDFFQFTDEQLWGPSALRNAPDERFPREHTTRETAGLRCDCCGMDLDTGLGETAPQCYLTPRHALQQLGTEFGRRCYPDVWVDYAVRTAEAILVPNALRRVWQYSPERGLYDPYHPNTVLLGYIGPKGVVISDARFPNEVAAIRAKGGRIWKTVHGVGLSGAAGAHESERYIDSLEVDTVVPDSGLDALPGIIANMLNETQGDGASSPA